MRDSVATYDNTVVQYYTIDVGLFGKMKKPAAMTMSENFVNDGNTRTINYISKLSCLPYNFL